MALGGEKHSAWEILMTLQGQGIRGEGQGRGISGMAA